MTRSRSKQSAATAVVFANYRKKFVYSEEIRRKDPSLARVRRAGADLSAAQDDTERK
jgi:hypothetical protein